MRKYPPNEPACEAVYDNTPANNPLLAAMPEMLSREQFMDAVRNMPGPPHNLPQMPAEERLQSLSLLASVFIPMDYMYAIYDQLYRAVRGAYTARSAVEETRRINELFCGQKGLSFDSQAVSGSVLGVPGIGKTSTICHALSTMPQVIEHTKYRDSPFFCKQVLYLRIECPSDCSVKTLAFNLVAALDSAIGSDYLHQMSAFQKGAASAVATQMKILCMTHHVGLLLVDEIQNAAETASKNRQVKPLLRFLVELTNDTPTAVFFVGTPSVEQLFTSQEHLRRRTRGIRLLPLKPDGSYRRFLEQLWPYQFTQGSAPLTDQTASRLFDFSGGIPAYIVKIFQESQAQALVQGQKRINEKMMRRAMDILAIKVPKTYSGGTYISDFELTGEICSETPVELPASVPAVLPGPAVPPKTEEHTVPEPAPEFSREEIPSLVPRLYANQRGRKADARDGLDLTAAFQSGCGMVQFLRENNLLEVWTSSC